MTEKRRAELKGIYPILKFFGFAHLPENLRPTSKLHHDLAFTMSDQQPRGAETAAGLRKLLEAKDCFVRAALPE